MASGERAISQEEARTAVARILLEQVRQDQHPSRTHMEMLEQMLPPSLQREYFNLLLEKVLDGTRPSITMLRHVARIAQRL
jgi:hypothetical protein